MKPPLKVLTAISLAVITTAAAAQVPPPTCSAPPKPARMENNEQISKWLKKVEMYQNCLMSYSAKHKQLSASHASAANQAVTLEPISKTIERRICKEKEVQVSASTNAGGSARLKLNVYG